MATVRVEQTSPAMAELRAALDRAETEALRRDAEASEQEARADAAVTLLEALFDVVRRVPREALSEEDWRRVRLLDHAAHATLPPEVVALVESDLEKIRRGEPLEDGITPEELSAKLRRIVRDG